MRGQFAPIRGQYSPMFKQLVRDLLQKDPEFRPSATTILLERMPELLSQFENRYLKRAGKANDENAAIPFFKSYK